MEIKVERFIKDDELVFTITCSDPHESAFGAVERQIMGHLEECKDKINKCSTGNELTLEVNTFIHGIKEEVFENVKTNLTFAIDNALKNKYMPMCQEIYNWIFDHQKLPVRTWMQEFDPQRTKYYFDNDKTTESDFTEY